MLPLSGTPSQMIRLAVVSIWHLGPETQGWLHGNGENEAVSAYS